MNRRRFSLAIACCALTLSAAPPSAAPRTDWIDPDTGHRIIRLSVEPGSQTLYFHDNAYSPEGDKYVFSSPSGIMLIDLAKLGSEPPKAELIVPNGGGTYMARRTREVYFTRGGPRRGAAPATAPGVNAAPAAPRAAPEVFAYNYDTKVTRRVPNASRTLINADETETVTTITAEDPSGRTPRPVAAQARPQLERMFPGKRLDELTPEQQYSVNKEEGLARRALNPESMAFVFTNLKSGEPQTVGYQYGWLNHMQFSPTDPTLLLYCHEGTWHEVDRIWTIRTDGSEKTLRHARTMDMEIAGHEFWSFDGKHIWFDLQTPRSQVFWIAGVDLASGKETRYRVDRDAWSVHYNVSRDNMMFMGDGGDETQVAFAKDGMWINLFTVQPGNRLERERLVNMSKHNYVTGRGGVEPNGSITPDKRWVIFTGNFDGERHVYAVGTARSN
ncbi:MAG: oligogalacturonate lyase family protein [Gemmatimonadota bacterium]|nr:oligogalacturonate lyase family protein [Gemmatimonadota bacterium]